MKTHEFSAKSVWLGGLGGDGLVEAGELKTSYSVPRPLGGPGKGSNPEEMLLAAATACFSITLAAALERRGLPAEAVEVTSAATFSFDGRALRLVAVEHRPRLRAVGAALAREQLAEALKAAADACMVSRALNVAVTIHFD